MISLVIAKHIAWNYENEPPNFSNITFSLNNEKVGLLGRNGVGKSTLLKLVNGQLQPSEGEMIQNGCIAYLPQNFYVEADMQLIDILEIRDKIDALKAIMAGKSDQHYYDILDEDWLIEERTMTLLRNLNLSHLTLDRKFKTLSGGEATRIYLAKLIIAEPDLLLLDEPTNNLDFKSRQAFYQIVTDWKKGMLVVSHDRKLLNLMDRIFELSTLGLKQYEGNYEEYCFQNQQEEEAAKRRLKDAEKTLKKTKQSIQETKQKHQKRQSIGKKKRKTGSQPKIVMNAKQERSEGTLSGLSKAFERRLETTKKMVLDAKKQIENLELIDVSLDTTAVPDGKIVLEINDLSFCYQGEPLLFDGFNLTINGAQRIWLKGANGSGKTTLMKLIQNAQHNDVPGIRVGVEHIAYLDQHIQILNENLSIYENFRRFQPKSNESHLRFSLARFLFSGDSVFRKVKHLSGGERLRVAMACTFMDQQAPPQLLLLDEPTNHLDLTSIRSLEAILNKYMGAIVVITHDENFVENIRVAKTIMIGN